MAIKLNQFIKSVITVEEPYNLTFVFSRPTALELIQIQSQTSQLYAKLSSEEDKKDAMADLIRYQVDTIKNHVTELSGFEDEDGKAVTISVASDLATMVERLPINLLGVAFTKFLESVFPTIEEKKS
jgi:hypothetical protein